jgi:hypothetical protein
MVIVLARSAIERLIRERVRAPILSPGDMTEDYFIELTPQGQDAVVQRNEPRVPHPVAADRLPNQQLRVHAHLHAPRSQRKGSLQPGD